MDVCVFAEDTAWDYLFDFLCSSPCLAACFRPWQTGSFLLCLGTYEELKPGFGELITERSGFGAVCTTNPALLELAGSFGNTDVSM